MTTEQTIKEEVRKRYGKAATRARESAADGGCCGGKGDGNAISSHLYTTDEIRDLPQEAVVASLGCGNPVAIAELREGETVLDLCSGGGIDVLLSARRVGPSGTAYGLDMTDEMLDVAHRNATESGVENAKFLKGEMQAIPLPHESVDVVISNCVVNLSPDKPRVLGEVFRVLRAGGRVGITDIVAEDGLTPEDRAERGSYVGCIAGALTKGEYERELAAAGFGDISISFT